MTALVVTVLRYAFLILLWLLVLAVLSTVRNDVARTKITGARQSRRSERRAAQAATAATTASSAPSTNINTPANQHAHLLVTAGPLAGASLELGVNTILVGRSPDSSLVLDDSYASARHAQFYRYDGNVYVEDLNSTNGTWVGNERIHQPTLLQPGVPVTIGKTTLELER